VRHQRGAGDNLMFPFLEKVQKGLPEFVTSHLSVTFLILEGASFNVNQAGKNSRDWRQYDPHRRHEVFSKLVEPPTIPSRVGKCLWYSITLAISLI